MIFPTETVYGLGCLANRDAVERLRAAKGRDAAQPFTVHVARSRDAERFLPESSSLVRRLARRLWPGPLTLVCEVADPSAAEVAQHEGVDLTQMYHDGWIGLRCPDHPACRELLAAIELPFVATSANRTGQPPPSTFDAAVEHVGSFASIGIDGGPTRFRDASTIVRVENDAWKIERAGAIDQRIIERCARTTVLMVCTGNSCRSPLAEYLFRQQLAKAMNISPQTLFERGFVVESAGSAAYDGAPMSDGSAIELRQRQLDPSSHRAQRLTQELIQRSAWVYVMTTGHRDAILSIAPGAADRVQLLSADGGISDPIGGGPTEYRACAAQIEQAAAARVKEVLDEDLSW